MSKNTNCIMLNFRASNKFKFMCISYETYQQLIQKNLHPNVSNMSVIWYNQTIYALKNNNFHRNTLTCVNTLN